jgi:hypothetical protein
MRGPFFPEKQLSNSFLGKKICLVNIFPPPTIIEIEVFEMPDEK